MGDCALGSVIFVMLLLCWLAATTLTLSTKATFRGITYSATVVPACDASQPPLVLLPPIGVGIDRTFCKPFVEAWSTLAPGPALHVIDVVGVGDSSPKPKMKRPFGGWSEPPRTPTDWAEQTLSYIRDYVGEPCVIVGQSNLCAVALEAAELSGPSGLVRGIVLVGPPAVEALSIDKPPEKVQKVWRLVGSPIGAALFRFARRRAFLASFSKKNLFADPSKVDDDYLDICVAGAKDASSRHAVFSFVAGTWRKNYTPLLGRLTLPTLIVSGRDIGAGEGVGNAPSAPSEVDKTSYKGLLSWFSVWRKEGRGGRFAQVARDLGTDPAAKLRDFAGAMPAAAAAGTVETAMLPGWNVLVYESPSELAVEIGGFVRRRFGASDEAGRASGAQAWTAQAIEAIQKAKVTAAAAAATAAAAAAAAVATAAAPPAPRPDEVRSWYDSGVRLFTSSMDEVQSWYDLGVRLKAKA